MKMKLQRNNLTVVAVLVDVIGVMTGAVAYSPVLYRLFCAATGYGGTAQRAESSGGTVSDRVITVRFDTNIATNLPWRFEPEQSEVKLRLGEQKLVFFSAENLSDQAVAGRATFNVLPEAAGIYFKKIQCFCFDKERLHAGQKLDMPVLFLVDPTFATDSATEAVNSITLSYTFHRSAAPDKAKDLSLLAVKSDPDPTHGQQLFLERCAACHSLDINKSGPMLGGILGRKAGTSPGYAYSPALRQSDIAWSADTLDRWLADPRGFMAGARMPVRVLESSKDTGESSQESAPSSVAQHSSARTNR